MKKSRFLLVLVLLVFAIGCGPTSSPQQQVVRVTVSTSGSLSGGESLAGIGMTMALPAEVAPALDASGQVDAARLVTPSGVTATGGLAVTALHLAAAAGQPARLSLVVASKARAGFGVGESMVLTLNRADRATPQVSNFSITEFSAANLAGQPVSGLQAGITAVSLQ
jgi:hypothetical protein